MNNVFEIKNPWANKMHEYVVKKMQILDSNKQSPQQAVEDLK